MLPDGPPVLGASGGGRRLAQRPPRGSGWARRRAPRKLVADAIAGRTTPIQIDGLGVERLRA